VAVPGTRDTLPFAPLPVRAHPLVLGVVLFLASELMFFAGLFAAYYSLRSNTSPWPPRSAHLDPVEAACGTAFLFLGSLVMVLATRALDRGRLLAARAWTGTAIVAGLAFVSIALHGYAGSGLTIATNAYGSVYYALTGFHLLHVVAGIGILVALFAGFRSGALRANHRAVVEAMTYYWHFVFVVWLGIFGTVYLIR
jgi:cytochrome c oxidase subunit 3